MITGKTKVYGLIGNPVSQSFSPFIHNKLAQEMCIDMTYVTFPVAKGDINEAFKGMLALGIQGMNVTVPYKSDIMACIDVVDTEAKTIGAVNTLVYTEEGIKGYNTDWVGLRQSLYNKKIGLKDKKILILGAGGSARATAVMCAKEGASQITIANRTIIKADTIAGIIKNNYSVQVSTAEITKIPDDCNPDIIFQTTPIGMYPKPGVTPLENKRLLECAEVAVDLIYNPNETLFLTQAKDSGCQIINGLEMLFYQAVKAFELWNDIIVPVEIQNRSLAAFEAAVKEKV